MFKPCLTTEQAVEIKKVGDSFCYLTLWETARVTQKRKVASDFEVKMQIYVFVAIMMVKQYTGQMTAFSSSPPFCSMSQKTPNTPKISEIFYQVKN